MLSSIMNLLTRHSFTDSSVHTSAGGTVALDNIENYQVLAFDSLDQLAEAVRTFRSQHPETEDYMRYVDLLVESLGDPVVRRVEDPDRG